MAIDDVRLRELPKDNAAMTELVEPSGALCPGSIDPIVAVTNTGLNDLTSVDIISEVNGTRDTTNFSFPAVITGDSVHLKLPAISFVSGVTYDLEYIILDPNGVADGDNDDDTISFQGVNTGLQGNITLDPGQPASATNFTSFNALSDELNAVGVCGLVTVTVANGTYTDNLQFLNVPGTSPNDRIVIDGKISGLCDVTTWRGTMRMEQFVFQGSSYITVKNMTIENATTFGDQWGVHFSLNSHHDSIINCDIRLGTTFNNFGVGASALITNDFSEGNNANWITVMDCNIEGGAWSIKFEGPVGGNGYNVGNHFINNTMVSWNAGGFQTDQQDSLRIIDNVIENPRSAFADAMLLIDPMNFSMRRNYIFSNDVTVNIINGNSSKTADKDADIINNMIISTEAGFTGGDDGMIISNPTRIRILHNSIYNEASNGPALSLNGFALIDSLDVRNNAFSIE